MQSHRFENNICVLSAHGELRENIVQEMIAYVDSNLEVDTMESLIINLGEVPDLDSTGIGWLVSIFRRFRVRQAKFALCELNERCLKVFKLTQLDKSISIYPTEKEALKGLEEE